jgi:hypothetical protein
MPNKQHGYIIILKDSSGNWPFSCSFRSSCRTNKLPLPPWCSQHPRQDCSTTDCLEYRRHTYSFYITHSPFTLSKLSSLNLVSIFRCSSPSHNPFQLYLFIINQNGVSMTKKHFYDQGNFFAFLTCSSWDQYFGRRIEIWGRSRKVT